MTITLPPEQEEPVRDLLRSQNEWLLAHRDAVDAQIDQGIAELDRGEGIPEADLDAYLARLKAEPE
jgi:hypothetical protein